MHSVSESAVYEKELKSFNDKLSKFKMEHKDWFIDDQKVQGCFKLKYPIM